MSDFLACEQALPIFGQAKWASLHLPKQESLLAGYRLLCFLCFTSPGSLTGSYTQDKPFQRSKWKWNRYVDAKADESFNQFIFILTLLYHAFAKIQRMIKIKWKGPVLDQSCFKKRNKWRYDMRYNNRCWIKLREKYLNLLWFFCTLNYFIHGEFPRRGNPSLGTVQCMQNRSRINNECFDHKTFQAYN